MLVVPPLGVVGFLERGVAALGFQGNRLRHLQNTDIFGQIVNFFHRHFHLIPELFIKYTEILCMEN